MFFTGIGKHLMHHCGSASLWLSTIVGQHLCDSVPLWLSTIVTQYHCGSVPLWLSIIVAQHHCGSAPLWLSTIVAQYHCGSVPLWLSAIVGQHHCGSAPLWVSTIVTQHHCGSAPLWLSTIVAQHHSGSAPLLDWLDAYHVCWMANGWMANIFLVCVSVSVNNHAETSMYETTTSLIKMDFSLYCVHHMMWCLDTSTLPSMLFFDTWYKVWK